MKLKKLIPFCVLTLFLTGPGFSASAQKPELPWHVAFRAGIVGNVYENVGSYLDHKKVFNLITPSFGITAGYDFTEAFSLRMTLSSDANAGACNSKESGGLFYPYRFSSLNVFADAMLNLSRRARARSFVPKLYVGLGYAHTFNFTKKFEGTHPWANMYGELPHVVLNNHVMGFRAGFLLEYLLTPEVGILMDLCGELYTDLYDGLQPARADQDQFSGYGGFPFDARGILTLGLAYHF